VHTYYTHKYVFSEKIPLAKQGAWITVNLRRDPLQIEALKQAGKAVEDVTHQIPALIDTGASCTCVDDRIAAVIGRQVDVVCLAGVHDASECSVYSVEFEIGPWRQTWRIVGIKRRDERFIPCILGRDILRFFTLFYVGPEERFGLYHGVPPVVKKLMQESRVSP